MKTTNILSTRQFDDEILAQWRAISPALSIRQQTCRDAAEISAALTDDVEVLYTYQVPTDLLVRAPRLRWIQLHSAGADHLLGNPAMESDVLVTTTSGLHAVRIAEYVFASIFAFAYRVPRMLHYQRRREWPGGRWDLFAGMELRGQTIGLVGYGSIGREVGRIAHALGMRVLASKRSPRLAAAEAGYRIPGTGDPQGVLLSRLYSPDELPEMMAECDFVVVTAPLTPQTQGLISEAVLRAMKPSAYLVNVGRGPVVDERALIRALREGWIAGVGLDVFEEEPLPAGSPLWELARTSAEGEGNVIISPHVAGFTLNYDERAVEIFSENLRRYLAAEPLLNLVDKERGY
ncbi:MAG: D-2-hydroxyacid dehydrogenase [Chloroflexota bacterium]|nr:D-2-hydroxyacid dehydrogenase [Chloroflexota bacterium]